jgi:hypothetical protein
MTSIPPLDDDRMIALVGAVVRKAIKDAAAGYTHPTHPDPRAFLAAAGLLERVTTLANAPSAARRWQRTHTAPNASAPQL